MEETDESIKGHLEHCTIVFDTLLTCAFLIIVAILVTAALSKRVNRAATWYSFLISWAIFAVSYVLLPMKPYGYEAPFGACLFQATMIYAAPPAATTATACLVAEVYLRLQASMLQKTPPRWTTLLLVSLPFCVFAAVAIEAFAVGLTNKPLVKMDPSYMFCHIRLAAPAVVTAVFCVVAVALHLCISIMVLVRVYLNWRKFKQVQRYSAISTTSSSQPFQVSKSVLVRIVLFIVAPLVLVSIPLGYLINPSLKTFRWNMFLPTAPLLAALIFGTQKDILRVWMSPCIRDNSSGDFNGTKSEFRASLATQRSSMTLQAPYHKRFQSDDSTRPLVSEIMNR
ncbi:hypothetical protein AX16_001727 [Volvariella volvacea WC 439]|nr:hypothetical protein AX16_001727 [Volvariella volvacea WC 439]